MKATGTMTMLLCLTLCLGTQAQKKEKVILDTDMVEVFDDGITMMMLANSPQIDLLGVTIVVGNTWVPEGTAYAIRQLETIGRRDIPVYPGIRLPLCASRIETIKTETALFGIGDGYVGSAGYAEPESWLSFYKQRYNSEPTMQPSEVKAVNYIIDEVKKHPDEITIIAIGTCANLAAAVRIAPEIIPLIKRVIYMGGSFFIAGNTTPAAEFNWWLDPDAAKICVRTPFKEQIIVGLDVCEKMPFVKSKYHELIGITKNAEIKNMLKGNFLYKQYEDNPDYVHYIWDVIAGAIAIDPTLITEEVTRHVDVCTQFGPTYGKSLAYTTNPPIGAQQARIVLSIDNDRLWTMIGKFLKE